MGWTYLSPMFLGTSMSEQAQRGQDICEESNKGASPLPGAPPTKLVDIL